MESLIDYLNENGVAVQAIAAVLLALLTTAYVIATYWLVNATRRTQRPYVFLDIVAHGGNYLEFGLANYGERVAEDVRIEVERDIVDSDGKALSEGPPFSSGVTYLPPKRSYRWSFLAPEDFFDATPETNVLRARILYSHGKKHYEEKVDLDFASLDGVLLKSFADWGAETATHLKEIARHLSTDNSRAQRDALVSRMFHRPCPSCRESVSRDATRCPHCLDVISPADDADEVADEDASTADE